MNAVLLAADIDDWLGLGLAVVLIVLLLVALLFPEKF